jgi:hypothetical protein
MTELPIVEFFFIAVVTRARPFSRCDLYRYFCLGASTRRRVRLLLFRFRLSSFGAGEVVLVVVRYLAGFDAILCDKSPKVSVLLPFSLFRCALSESRLASSPEDDRFDQHRADDDNEAAEDGICLSSDGARMNDDGDSVGRRGGGWGTPEKRYAAEF